MPSRIEVHALTHVTGEPDRLPSPVPPHDALAAVVEPAREAAAERCHTPVTHDPAGRPDSKPEASADHRASPPAGPVSGRQLRAVDDLTRQRAPGTPPQGDRVPYPVRHAVALRRSPRRALAGQVVNGAELPSANRAGGRGGAMIRRGFRLAVGAT